MSRTNGEERDSSLDANETRKKKIKTAATWGELDPRFTFQPPFRRGIVVITCNNSFVIIDWSPSSTALGSSPFAGFAVLDVGGLRSPGRVKWQEPTCGWEGLSNEMTCMYACFCVYACVYYRRKIFKNVSLWKGNEIEQKIVFNSIELKATVNILYNELTEFTVITNPLKN